jgi:hypothetical protein
MSWQFVVLVCVFVAGSVLLGVTGHESMCTFFAGAAAGIAGQPLINRVNPPSPPDIPPPLAPAA